MSDDSPMPDRRGWWARNWKWFVPTGCLVMVLLVVALVAGTFTMVMGMMRGSDAYDEAMRAARANPALVAAIGTPIEEGSLVSGAYEDNGATGKASLAIPVTGPRGNATIYIEGAKSAGEWRYDVLVAEVEATKERIELRAPVD
jgi:hypothetical protein